MPCSEEYSTLLAQAERAYEGNEMEKAIALFMELADAGVPDACMYLALIYRGGDGVPVDKKQSQIWYSKYVLLLNRLSNSGNRETMLELGKLYQYGNVVERNEKKAIELIEKAAEAGSIDAQFHLATQYLFGWCGCERSEVLYRQWLDRAAASGHSEALFRKGVDLVADESTREQGYLLIHQAAEQGHWQAKDWISRD